MQHMAEYLQTEYADVASALTADEAAVFAVLKRRAGGSADADSPTPEDAGLGVFFHLSPMRQSILNWYPFETGATLLEVGGGMGALTGLFCRRLARVVSVEARQCLAKAAHIRHGACDNLTVVNGDICHLPGGAGLPDAYDYIVALDPPALDGAFLSRLAQLLKPHGRLLLAAENRFALRYWCGKKSRETGQPYDGLAGNGGLLSRRECARRLASAGFAGQKWYSPLTDHWFTDEVYSDAKQPNRFLNTRFSPYVENDDSLQLYEGALYEDAIDGGAFPFLCNAYLVEARARQSDACCDVDYAALTTYRAPDKCFATTVHAGGTVRKTALRPQGVERLAALAHNHAALRARGIPVVETALCGGHIEMPFVPHGTLWDYWQNELREGRFDADAITRMFDRLRDIVLQSSGSAPAGTNGWDAALGAVQTVAYPELVPANCFYDEQADTLLFFDQEYTRENCPASVPLSRALLSLQYSPVLAADARAGELLQKLVARYGLAGCWDTLLQIETAFMEDLFNDAARRPLLRETAQSIAALSEKAARREAAAAAARLADGPRKKIGLYGMGKRGRHLLAALRDAGAEVVFALDRNPEAVSTGAGGPPLPVFKTLRDVPPAMMADIIIVTPKAGAEEIAGDLRKRAPVPVWTLAKLLASETETAPAT